MLHNNVISSLYITAISYLTRWWYTFIYVWNGASCIATLCLWWNHNLHESWFSTNYMVIHISICMEQVAFLYFLSFYTIHNNWLFKNSSTLLYMESWFPTNYRHNWMFFQIKDVLIDKFYHKTKVRNYMVHLHVLLRMSFSSLNFGEPFLYLFRLQENLLPKKILNHKNSNSTLKKELSNVQCSTMK